MSILIVLSDRSGITTDKALVLIPDKSYTATQAAVDAARNAGIPDPVVDAAAQCDFGDDFIKWVEYNRAYIG